MKFYAAIGISFVAMIAVMIWIVVPGVMASSASESLKVFTMVIAVMILAAGVCWIGNRFLP